MRVLFVSLLGMGLAYWLQRVWRAACAQLPPCSPRWINENAYSRDGRDHR